MIALLADENFSGHVVRGLRRHHPDIDIVTVQEVGLLSADDPQVLEWAANHDRLLVTHDVQTMIGFASARTAARQRMPGLIEADRTLPARRVIAELYIIAACLEIGEWEGQIIFLPL